MSHSTQNYKNYLQIKLKNEFRVILNIFFSLVTFYSKSLCEIKNLECKIEYYFSPISSYLHIYGLLICTEK